ncbi:predicted protein [Arabidopsis lyrata subsp. lyrata]|uniref:Predicted protein n=1 Tax=Arabidopsis lyrata subsp. lyrata TaxID=81972 RepID=D7KP08_ARALL|nr:predicted protein [Arabidopsis lyrata subsp. lyrata]
MAQREILELSVTMLQTTHVTPLETHNNILPDYYSDTRGQTSPPTITLRAGVNSEESPLPPEYQLDKAKLVAESSQMVNRWRTGCA